MINKLKPVYFFRQKAGGGSWIETSKDIMAALHILGAFEFRVLYRLSPDPLNEAEEEELRDSIGQVINDTIASGAPDPDWCDSREIDRLADAVLNFLKQEESCVTVIKVEKISASKMEQEQMQTPSSQSSC